MNEFLQAVHGEVNHLGFKSDRNHVMSFGRVLLRFTFSQNMLVNITYSGKKPERGKFVLEKSRVGQAITGKLLELYD